MVVAPGVGHDEPGRRSDEFGEVMIEVIEVMIEVSGHATERYSRAIGDHSEYGAGPPYHPAHAPDVRRRAKIPSHDPAAAG